MEVVDKESQSTETPKEEPPVEFNKLKVVGVGTFGKVYLVSRKNENKLMALKRVFQNKKYKNRELEILEKINSPFIVQLETSYFEEAKEGTYLNLVMEYLPETLSKKLSSCYYGKKLISNQDVKSYAFCIMSALAYLQSQNICHRDIKPSNILINDQAMAKICDFGSAKELIPGKKNIAYICSRYYRAPELIMGATNYTTKIDVWSAGCVIAEMLTNRTLFQGSNNTSMLLKIIKILGTPTPEDLKAMKCANLETNILAMEPSGIRNRIRKHNPNASEQIMDLLDKILVYDPQKRLSASQSLAEPVFQTAPLFEASSKLEC